MVLYQWMLQER